MIRIGVVGYGYWGPNIVRNLRGVDGCEVAAVCDRSPDALKRVAQAYPDIAVTDDVSELMASPKIDAVAVVTPVCTHFQLAKAALQNGKHVFIEKPFTATTAEAEELIELAARRNLKIMVDHTFLFTGAAIMDFLIREKPEAVIATGETHLNGLVDVAYITVYFPRNTIAHINVNWLSPVKIRTTLIGGEKRMLVWNDLEADEKLKIYDKGVQMTNRQGVYDLLVSYRSGDMWAPRVEQAEALKVELSYFVECVRNDLTPLNDGMAGLRVVQLLEAADRSLKDRGRAVRL